MAAPREAEVIQDQMRHIRAELRADVQDFVAGAREMSDWTYYVRTYPWVCLGAAAAVGYLVVPTRPRVLKPDPQSLVELAKHNQVVVKMEEPRPKKTLLATVLGMAANSLLHGGMALVSQQLDELLHSRKQVSHESNGRGSRV
jgi:hypothetical protein